jgi:hypothetical protein
VRRARSRVWPLALAALALASPAAAEFRPPVRLDRAGLATLARENPAHYERVQQILRVRSQVGNAALPGCVGVSFDARDVSMSAVLLTTAPPQQELGFVLDDVRYVMRLTPRAAASPGIEILGSAAPAAPCPARPR